MQLKKWFSWGMVIAWMAVIFSFSAQQATDSGNLSGSILIFIMKVISFLLPTIEVNQSFLHLLIRKGAHFSVYLILGILTSNALRLNGVSGIKQFGFSLLICALYAMSDEFHQSFVPGRGPSLQDVLIDSSGATVGILLYQAFTQKFKRL